MSGVAWTLAVAQMDCATGDTERNLATIARFAREAASQQADLAVFPNAPPPAISSATGSPTWLSRPTGGARSASARLRGRTG